MRFLFRPITIHFSQKNLTLFREVPLSRPNYQVNCDVDVHCVLYLIEGHEEKGEKVVGVKAELARSPRAV